MSGREELRALVWALKCADEWMSCVEGHLRNSYTFKRDREAIRAHLARAESSLASPAGMEGWMPIETAPKDGAFVLLYWPTMSITQFPAVGFHHGDEYGWELAADRDYGEIIPTLWCQIPPLPAAPRGEAE